MKGALVHGAWLLIAAGAGFLFYLALLAGGLAAGGILFYRGLALAVLAALAAAALGALIARWRSLPPLALASGISCFSVSACFLVLFPVTIDRSVSVYLLASVERQGPAGTTPAALERSFVAGYVEGMGAVGRRIAEQRASGNVVVGANGRIRLTPRGRRFVSLSRRAARLLGTDRRYVDGWRGAPPPTTAAAPRR